MKFLTAGLFLLVCIAVYNCQEVTDDCFIDVSSERGVNISQEVLSNITSLVVTELNIDDLQTAAQVVGEYIRTDFEQADSLNDIGAIVSQLVSSLFSYQDQAIDALSFLVEALKDLTSVCVDGEPLQPQQFLEELFKDLNIDAFPNPEPVVEVTTGAVSKVWDTIAESNVTQFFVDSFNGIIDGIQSSDTFNLTVDRINEIAAGVVESTVTTFQNFTSDWNTTQVQDTIESAGDLAEVVSGGVVNFVQDIGNWFTTNFWGDDSTTASEKQSN